MQELQDERLGNIPKAQLPKAELIAEDKLTSAELMAVLKRLPAYTLIVGTLYRDRRIPRWKKVLLLAGLGYVLSPIDLIPGFIPGIGLLDDVIVMLAVLRKVFRSLPDPQSQKMLKRYGLSLQVVEQDLAVAKKAVRIMGRKAGKAVARTARACGKGISAAGKSIRSTRERPRQLPG